MSHEERKSYRELEEERRRSYILEVAERLFARGGFHETSVGDIAKEAGFGVGTLYKYFKDKDELFRNLLEWRVEENFRKVEDAIDEGGSSAAVVDRIIDIFVDEILGHSDYMMLYLNYIHARPDALHQDGNGGFSCIHDRKKQQFERLEEVFRQGIEEGVFTDVPPYYLSGALHGILMSTFFTTHFRLGGQWDPDDVKRIVKKIFLEPVLMVSQVEATGVLGASVKREDRQLSLERK
jgi:AcrR family transcriptional regulator